MQPANVVGTSHAAAIKGGEPTALVVQEAEAVGDRGLDASQCLGIPNWGLLKLLHTRRVLGAAIGSCSGNEVASVAGGAKTH